MPKKILLLGGGGVWVFLEGGGGSADFICMGVGIFPIITETRYGSGSEIAARNRRSLATFHRTLKSQCGITFSCLGNR